MDAPLQRNPEPVQTSAGEPTVPPGIEPAPEFQQVGNPELLVERSLLGHEGQSGKDDPRIPYQLSPTAGCSGRARPLWCSPLGYRSRMDPASFLQRVVFVGGRAALDPRHAGHIRLDSRARPDDAGGSVSRTEPG